MEIENLDRLTTLGHANRMAVFRLLMRRYPGYVPAGELAHALDLKPSTLSVYLSALTRVGLISQKRVATSVQYQANLGAAREVSEFVFRDCCQGRAQLCQPFKPSALEKTNDGRVKFNAIFICTGNSARSILAESILRFEAGDRFNAFSAGTHPAAQPDPFALELLAAQGHDISGLASKNLDAFQATGAPQMDFIFTVCDAAANEECPIWPGRPISGHWGLPDPAAVGGTDVEKRQAIERAYDHIRARITEFVKLPTKAFGEPEIQTTIDKIGAMPASSES